MPKMNSLAVKRLHFHAPKKKSQERRKNISDEKKIVKWYRAR